MSNDAINHYLGIIHARAKEVRGLTDSQQERINELEAELRESLNRETETLNINAKLEAERDEDLEAENTQLRLERDYALARIETLKAENVEAESDLEDSYSREAEMHKMYDDLKADSLILQESNQRLEARCAALEVDKAAVYASNAALRAGQVTWPEHDDFPYWTGGLQEEMNRLSDALKLANREKGEWEANYTELANSTPRVISAEELRVGQWVAYDQLGPAGWATVKITSRNADTMRGYAGDLVLLAEAPESESMADWERELLDEVNEMNAPEPGPTVVHDDGGKPWSVELLPVGDAPAKPADKSTATVQENDENVARPLTVHALNVAPVGSVVRALPKQVFHKAYSGHWHQGTGGPAVEPETVLAAHPDATLTHPERGDHEQPALPAEPKRFALVRDEDETGVSGTGKVAEGIIYSDDHVSMRWIVGEHRSTVAYDSITAVEAIHGHGGKTQVVIDHE